MRLCLVPEPEPEPDSLASPHHAPALRHVLLAPELHERAGGRVLAVMVVMAFPR